MSRPLRIPGRSKYRAQVECSKEADRASRTYVGVVYHSRAEARYAARLDQLRGAADPKERVVSVQGQVRIPLEVYGRLVTTWIADFKVSFADGRTEIHEVKGFETPEWKIKRKLFEALRPWVVLRIVK